MSPEYVVTTLRTMSPRKNSAPSELRLSMTRVKPASLPQCWRAISRAAAVHRLCPHSTCTVSPGPDVVRDGLLERHMLHVGRPLSLGAVVGAVEVR